MKKLLLTAFMLFTITYVKAQTFTPPPYAEINTNYQAYINNVFGILETNRVSTGLLLDYGFAFTNPKIYNGVVLHDSTLVESGIFSSIYQTLYTSRFNNTIAMPHPSIQDSLRQVARQEEVIILSGLLYKYNAIDPNANTNNKLDVVNGQLKDKYINSVWQNPYQLFTTLAISPSVTSYNLTYGSVLLPSALWLTNMGAEVSSIQLDADDGQGYQTVTMNTAIMFNYADTGWKHWVFRVNLVGGQQLVTHTKLHIDNKSNSAGSGGGAQRGTNLQVEPITATKSFDGIFGQCKIHISYRDDNDRVIRKPLIVAEGLDLGHILKPEEPEGENTYEEFIDRIRNSGSNNLRQLLFNGASSEYDIIYVNWRNGSDYLQRNAYVLEEVITWVNNNKQPLNGVLQQNVVMGLSMGGVIARMALGDMERSNPVIPHNTRLYISVDGPQQGSNIPLGLQAATRHALKMYLKTGFLAAATETVIAFLPNAVSPYQALRSIDQPGAKQLLVQRIDENYNPDNTTHTEFYNELRTQWQYPTTTRNIIISNGSECAIDQEFAPGANLLYFERNTKTRFIGDLFLMSASLVAAPLIGGFVSPFIVPGSQDFHAKLDVRALANGGGNQIYFGKISYTKKVLWFIPVTITIAEKTYYAPSGLISFDTYPGSFFKLSLNNSLSGTSQDWMFTYNNSFQVQRRFTHVLTTSALDIGGGAIPLTNTQYFARYVGETPPANPYNVPSQINNFTAAYNQNPLIVIGPTNPSTNQPAFQFISTGNEEHTQLYLRNANFIAAELNGITNLAVNCSAYCDGGVANWPSEICSTSTFTIPGVSTGTTVTWSASTSGIVTITPVGNGGSATITRVGDGIVTITAVLTGDAVNVCGTKTFSKQVLVGTPIPEGINGPDHDLCYNGRTSEIGQFHVYNPRAGLTYYWQINGTGAGIGTTISVNAFMWDVGTHQIRVRSYSSACGYSDWHTSSFVVTDCSNFRYSVSPNPSYGTVSIESKSTKTIEEVRIKDKLGNIKQTLKTVNGTKKVLLDISFLSADIYFIEIFDGKEWHTEKVVKN